MPSLSNSVANHALRGLAFDCIIENDVNEEAGAAMQKSMAAPYPFKHFWV